MKNFKLLLLFIATNFFVSVNAQLKVGKNPKNILGNALFQVEPKNNVGLIVDTLGNAAIGTSTPNANALLHLEGTNKGVIIPKVGLTSTISTLPMTAHVRGMIVYNTDSVGTVPNNVIPGFYYNDGAKWVRIGAGKSTFDGAENGLSLDSNKVKLGGALTKSTTISGLSTSNKMNFIGTGVNMYNIDTTTFSIDGTNNRVGIGTTTPLAALNIVGGGLAIASGVGSAASRPALTYLTVGNYEIKAIGSGAGTSQANGAGDGFLRLTAGQGMNGLAQSGIDLSGYSGDPDMDKTIVFRTAATERMRIDRIGYVGIGTNTPISPLEVMGKGGYTISTIDTGLQSMINFRSTIATDSISDYKIFKADGKDAYLPGLYLWSYPKNGIGYGGCCHSRMTWLDNGNIGIGTNAPIYSLEIVSSWVRNKPNVLKLSNPTGTETILTMGADSGVWTNITGYRNKLGFRDASSKIEQFTIDIASGKIGIKDSAPTYNLDVKGTARVVSTPTISSATKALVKDPSTGQISEQAIPQWAPITSMYSTVNYSFAGSWASINIIYPTSENNPNNWYNTTNGRFTPTVAGWYEVTASFDLFTGGGNQAGLQIMKNGNQVAHSTIYNWIAQPVSKKIYLNGTTDYITIVGYSQAAGTRQQAISTAYFQAQMVSQ